MRVNKLTLAIAAIFGSNISFAQDGCIYQNTGPIGLQVNSGVCAVDTRWIVNPRMRVTGLEELRTIDIELDEYGDFLSTVYAYDYTLSMSPLISFSSSEEYLSLVVSSSIETMVNVSDGAQLTSYDNNNIYIGNASSDAQYNPNEAFNISNTSVLLNVEREGVLDFKKNLIVESLEDQFSSKIQSKNLNVDSGVVLVGGNLYAIMMGTIDGNDPRGKNNVHLQNGSTLDVNGDAYIRTGTGGFGLINESSNIDIKGDLTVINTLLEGSNAGNNKNYDDAVALKNIDGTVNVSNIKILSEGFTGLAQEGSVSTISAESILIDASVKQPGSMYSLGSSNSALTISGGKGYFGQASLKSNGSAIHIQGSDLAFSLGGSEYSELADLKIQQGKALLHIGNGASITSIQDHAIAVSDGVDSIIQIEDVNELNAAAGKNLIYDGSGQSVVNLESNSSLNGAIALNGGNDVINMKGIFAGSIDMGDGDDIANLYNANYTNLKLIDAGSGSQDTLNLFGEIDAATTYATSNQQGMPSGTVLQNFNIINIKNDAYFNLNGNTLVANQITIDQGGILALDPLVKDSTISGNVVNGGLINLDVNGSNIGQNLTIEGDYHGNDGVLEIDTRWQSLQNPNLISETDTLTINGNVTGRTRVSVVNGIAGDVTLMDNPVIPVPEIIISGNVAENAFWGYAPTNNAGEAQLLIDTQGKKFYWTLKTSGGNEIYSPDIPGYVLTGYINMEMIRDSVGTYRDRIGGEYNQAADYGDSYDGKTWGRAWHKNLKAHGDTRLDWKSNSSGYQFGYKFENRTTKNGLVRTDGYFSYARSSSKAYDDFSSESGQIINNKYSGSMHTHNVNLGLTRTYVSNTNSYTDMVIQFSNLKNHYEGRRGGKAANKAMGLTLSLEQGKQFDLNDRWYIEPMYQIMANYISMKDFNDGIRNVSQGSYWDGLIRVGGRIYFRDPINEAQNNLLYMKAHYVRDFKSNGSAQVGRSKIVEANAKQWADFGLGFQVNASKNTYFFMDAGFQRNLGGPVKSSHSVQFGINHKW